MSPKSKPWPPPRRTPGPLSREDESLQRDSLIAAGCQSVFIDMTSGHVEPRSSLNALLKRLLAAHEKK